jgi:hypothetical protein
LVLATFAASPAWAQSWDSSSWKFGVISDTQWTIPDDGKNPNTCAADIIKQVNAQFIAKGVKLVVAVGDMVDQGSPANDYTRALYAQDLYNAHIAFYPLRGNHEAAENNYMGSGADFRYAYPQIVPGFRAGWNNNTPGAIFDSLYPALALTANPPAPKSRRSTFLAGFNFSAPFTVNKSTDGVSYSFQYNDVTFVLLDQFKSPYYYASHIPDQQPWIDLTLATRPNHTHAFVFSHKNILGGNHKDNLFGAPANSSDPGDGYGIDPSTPLPTDDGSILTLGDKQAAEDAFLASLQTNRVKYMITGHDHHHYISVITSPNQKSKIHQLIAQSDSSKFYNPVPPVSPNDAPVEQELARLGFYIFTVNGPRVTIDYYADDHGNWLSGSSFPDGADPLPNGTTPALNFVKRSTTGYSLNGTEKLVAQNASYVMSDDTALGATMEHGFRGTTMSILAGTNGSHAATNYNKPTVKAVNTGWAPAEGRLASDILTLWGMADLGSEQTDDFVLAMSFDKHYLRQHLDNGDFGIATRDADGNWVNAVDTNSGGNKNFVLGPWNAAYTLGTYGVDPNSKTAWAVINHGGEFAVSTDLDSSPWHHK